MGSKKEETLPHEWSVMVDIEDITPQKPYHKEIVASRRECKDLARRLQVDDIRNLKADIQLTRKKNSHIIHARGTVGGDIKQKCVVTLDPVTEHVDAEVEGWYMDESQTVSFDKYRREREETGNKEIRMPEECDDPESVCDGQIDIAELAAQHLSLSINPYPHKEGVEYDGMTVEDAVTAETPETMQNPFAKLKEMKIKRDKE